MKPLTKKQQELLDYLRICERCPTFDEMKAVLGLKSKSGIHRLIEALEERGFIRRLANRARAIEVVEQPTFPDRAILSALPTRDLAVEARRRGLVLGEYHRDPVRVGELQKTRRRFVEVAA
jgi:repressor LexA